MDTKAEPGNLEAPKEDAGHQQEGSVQHAASLSIGAENLAVTGEISAFHFPADLERGFCFGLWGPRLICEVTEKRISPGFSWDGARDVELLESKRHVESSATFWSRRPSCSSRSRRTALEPPTRGSSSLHAHMSSWTLLLWSRRWAL